MKGTLGILELDDSGARLDLMCSFLSRFVSMLCWMLVALCRCNCFPQNVLIILFWMKTNTPYLGNPLRFVLLPNPYPSIYLHVRVTEAARVDMHFIVLLVYEVFLLKIYQ